MIFIFSLSFALGIFLSLFVLSPLFLIGKQNILMDEEKPIFFDPQWIETKNNLFKKLSYGRCEEDKINSLTENEALNNLITLCEKLEFSGHSWKESLNSLSKKESGKSSISFLIIIACFFFASHFFYPFIQKSYALEQNPQAIPDNVTIPPPFILEQSHSWVPSVNQFILIPDQGLVHVYYVGMFSNQLAEKQVKILFPFPKNISNLTIHSKETATLETNSPNHINEIVLNTPLSEKVNQFQAEFTLDAAEGKALWNSNSLKELPGVTIFILPETRGILRDLFPSLNIWPARFSHFPSDFKSILSSNVLKPEEENTQTGELSRQMIRVGNLNSPYPEFEINGVVPSRFSLYLGILFFACFFGAGLICFIAVSGKKK